MEEWVDVVDEADRVVARALRGEVRSRNLLHRTVSILCCNSRGEIYVHRRTATKDVFPSMYDMFVAGTVAAGDSYAATAERELQEEIGAVCQPTEFFKYRYEGPHSRSWTMVFGVTWDGRIVPQPSEIAWGEFMTPAVVAQRLNVWPFVPDGREIYAAYLDRQR